MNFLDISIYVTLAVAVAGYWFLKRRYSYFEAKGIPHIKPSWISGNMDGVGQRFHLADFMVRLYQEYKGKDVIAGFYSFVGESSIIITDLEVTQKHIEI